jgi:hypothetical protein
MAVKCKPLNKILLLGQVIKVKKDIAIAKKFDPERMRCIYECNILVRFRTGNDVVVCENLNGIKYNIIQETTTEIALKKVNKNDEDTVVGSDVYLFVEDSDGK